MSAGDVGTSSYGSIIYQLKEVGLEASSITELCLQVANILASTNLVSGLIIIMLVLTALMFYFGIAHLNKCPMQWQIPFYLLIGGGVGMVKVVTLFIKHRKIRSDENEDLNSERAVAAGGSSFNGNKDESYTSTSTQAIEVLLSVFIFGWFAVGNYWVFEIYPPPFSQSTHSDVPQHWCDRHLYNFAVAQLAICHALLFGGIWVFLLSLCFARYFAAYSDTADDWV